MVVCVVVVGVCWVCVGGFVWLLRFRVLLGWLFVVCFVGVIALQLSIFYGWLFLSGFA